MSTAIGTLVKPGEHLWLSTTMTGRSTQVSPIDRYRIAHHGPLLRLDSAKLKMPPDTRQQPGDILTLRSPDEPLKNFGQGLQKTTPT